MENGAIPALHINEHHQFLCIYVTSRVNQHACLKPFPNLPYKKKGRPISFQKHGQNTTPENVKNGWNLKMGPPLGSGDSLRKPAIFQVFNPFVFRAFLHWFGEINFGEFCRRPWHLQHHTWHILPRFFVVVEPPNWNICDRQMELFPQVGVKITNIWNHHPDSGTPPHQRFFKFLF